MEILSTSAFRKEQDELIIEVDTTIYVELAGDDVTGDGTVGAPFATPHKALSWLADKIIGDCEVTIQIGAGEFIFTESIKVNHPNSNKLHIIGAGLKDGSTGKPLEAWYVPIDGPYPGIGLTNKYICSARPIDHTTNTYDADYLINKDLVYQEFKTILRFNACNGFDIKGVYLKEIDKLAITGDYGDNIDEWYHQGINVGFNPGSAETVSDETQIRNGGFNLGPNKKTNEVTILGFDAIGIKMECGTCQAGDVTIISCGGGVGNSASFFQASTVLMVNLGLGCEFTKASTTSYPAIHIVGSISAIDFHGSLIAQFNLTIKGCGNGIYTNDSISNRIKIDYDFCADNKKLIGLNKSEVVFYRKGTFDATAFEEYTITPTSENNRLIFEDDFTYQNVVDMGWDIPLNVIQPKGNYIKTSAEILKDFSAKTKLETALASYVPDLSQDNYFEYTLDQGSVIANPISATKGQDGKIVIKQDATGNWTPTFGTNFVFPAGLPVMVTTANNYSVFKYTVITQDKILMEFVADFI